MYYIKYLFQCLFQNYRPSLVKGNGGYEPLSLMYGAMILVLLDCAGHTT